MPDIHRAGLTGRPVCGAKPDARGRLYISTSGVAAAMTCPDCKPKPIDPAAALAELGEQHRELGRQVLEEQS